MNLIIDIGNTLTKFFVFENNNIIDNQKTENSVNPDIEAILKEFPKIKNVILSSVSKDIAEINFDFESRFENFVHLKHTTPIPVKVLYETPQTLGLDRVAAIVGAYNIFPNSNVLAIDAGSAITFEFINEKNEYLGGTISPGMSMRFKALHSFTKKLPLLNPSNHINLIGKNTNEAIINGVQNGLIFEIDSYIESFAKKHKNLKVILTGGDTFFFAHKLKNRIFAKPFLVAIGLNRILKDNVKNK